MGREVLAKNLGYGSIHGTVLGKIGALRQYGLITGSLDEIRISDAAITILNAPEDGLEGKNEIKNCIFRPKLFRELREKYPNSLPSEENLKFEVIKHGFTSRAAKKVVQIYLKNQEYLVEKGINDDRYYVQSNESSNPPDENDIVAEETKEPDININEIEFSKGILSRNTKFCLLMTGKPTSKDIDRLIKKLQLDLAIIQEEEREESVPLNAPSEFENSGNEEH